jgi:nicotinamidase-related amidase
MLNEASHPALLDRSRSAVLVVDVQTAFADHIHGFAELVEQTVLLLRIAAVLGVPIAATEQYPKGLGSTVVEIVEAAGPGLETFDKLAFSACAAPGWQSLPPAVRDADQLIVVGIEAHVCVRQTTLGLLAAGRDVHVAVDAIGSSRPQRRDVALRELVRAGARETTVEQAAFDWMRSAEVPEFRAVQQLLVAAARS